MKKPDKAAFDALSDEQKAAAKWGLFMIIACFAGAALSMVGLFVYMVWSGPKPNFTVAAVWIGVTLAATAFSFNLISGRLRGIMGDSQGVTTDSQLDTTDTPRSPPSQNTE